MIGEAGGGDVGLRLKGNEMGGGGDRSFFVKFADGGLERGLGGFAAACDELPVLIV